MTNDDDRLFHRAQLSIMRRDAPPERAQAATWALNLTDDQHPWPVVASPSDGAHVAVLDIWRGQLRRNLGETWPEDPAVRHQLAALDYVQDVWMLSHAPAS